MPRHTDKDSERVAGAIPAGSPAFWPQEDFPQGILDGDFVRYVAATELWERQSSLDFIAEFTDAFGGGGGSYDQDLNTDDSPAFVTVKLSGLTDGRIPYHVNDATGLADGPLKSDVDDAVSKAHASGSDNQDLSGLVEKVTGYSLVADTEIAKIHALHADDVTIKSGGSPLYLSTQELSLVNNAVSPGTITTIDTDKTFAANSDLYIPTQKAVKGGIADHAALITGVHGLVFTAGKTLTLTESLTLNALPIGGLAVATAANTLGSLAVGTVGQYLAGAGAGTVPSWATLNQAAVAGLTTADGPSFAHLHLADLAAIYTAAESWIGPSSTTGIYFKGGNVGIGTTTPQTLLHVAGKLSCGDSVTSELATRSFNLISTDASVRVIRVHDEYGPSLEWISRSTGGSTVHHWDMYTVPATSRLSIRDRTVSDLDRLSITADGYVGIGTTTPGGMLCIGSGGGLTVGSNTDAGAKNLRVEGTATIVGAFGCNSKTAQTAYASGGALAAYGTGSYGLDSAANMSALHALVVKIRAALVANGIMS